MGTHDNFWSVYTARPSPCPPPLVPKYACNLRYVHSEILICLPTVALRMHWQFWGLWRPGKDAIARGARVGRSDLQSEVADFRAKRRSRTCVRVLLPGL